MLVILFNAFDLPDYSLRDCVQQHPQACGITEEWAPTDTGQPVLWRGDLHRQNARFASKFAALTDNLATKARANRRNHEWHTTRIQADRQEIEAILDYGELMQYNLAIQEFVSTITGVHESKLIVRDPITNEGPHVLHSTSWQANHCDTVVYRSQTGAQRNRLLSMTTFLSGNGPVTQFTGVMEIDMEDTYKQLNKSRSYKESLRLVQDAFNRASVSLNTQRYPPEIPGRPGLYTLFDAARVMHHGLAGENRLIGYHGIIQGLTPGRVPNTFTTEFTLDRKTVRVEEVWVLREAKRLSGSGISKRLSTKSSR